MTDHSNVHLTAAEVNGLWTNYLTDSMAMVFIKHFHKTCSNPKIKALLKHALTLSQDHLDVITSLFQKEHIPIPFGYNDSECNLDAPQLFSDEFYLCYLKNMTKTGLATYSAFLSGSSRQDIRTYCSKAVNTTAQLFNQATDLLLESGIEIRCPNTPYPKKNEWINDSHFLAGWWGERRPLSDAEVANLFVNLLSHNNIDILLTGFSQVAESKEVAKFLLKGKSISEKHIEVFSGFLKESELSAPRSWDFGATTSTGYTYSDRLIMTQVGILMQSCIADYGISLSLCHRRDLSLNYVRLTAELAQYASDGAKIMIKNSWMEKPPMTVDREKLSQ
ncbi:hypothetical protein GCM10011391_03620 [Pullulanibacillus camelliae]|uniref:DUF3231 family protein n=1 Tax=Pullulanibacillus camelliae TaxID=1707096 RepID=A0A8J2VLL6_9BACL|nr:DUF3231 family protein [Pullulanibacillus camelliae]GGE28343.1 hypothetical protein GCM10011391_03620 [Pullulanibacillus camelliae]